MHLLVKTASCNCLLHCVHSAITYNSLKPIFQRELLRVGASNLRWAIPPRQEFGVADTNMLVSKKPAGPNMKAGRPNASPNSSQRNIVRVVYARV